MSFQTLEKLGQGSFSEVYKVKRLCDGQLYAMKKVKMGMLKEKEKENALNEVRILASLQSQFIVGYREAFFEQETDTLCIIMEYADEGDLHKLIKEKIKNGQHFSEQEIWKAIVQITQGLKTLHDHKILHRDMKCANIFIQNGIFKLGDLNVSKIAKRGLVYTQTGTPCKIKYIYLFQDYASPEVWRDEPYDAKSDIWSFGCVIYEMCQLKPPFTANDMAGLYKKIQKGSYIPIQSRYSEQLSNFLSLLLRLNPSSRPSCDQLLLNPYLQQNGNQFIIENGQRQDNLLGTIRLPKNGGMKELNSRLPGKKYEDKENKSTIELDGKYMVIPRSQRLKNALRPVNKRPPICQSINVEDNRRLHRICSLQEHQQQFQQQFGMKNLSPIQNNLTKRLKELKRRPSSQYYLEPVNSQIESIQLQPREKNDEATRNYTQAKQDYDHLVIPPLLAKQLSDQTPLKDRTPQKQQFSNLPYLQDRGDSINHQKKKSSPYPRPKVVISNATPFQIARKQHKISVNVSAI